MSQTGSFAGGYPPMYPPTGGMPPANMSPNTGATRNDEPRRPGPEPPATTALFVLRYGSANEWAELDPQTGAMRPVPGPVGMPSGLFGDIEGLLVAFYRLRGRLMLRLGEQEIDVDDLAVIVRWERSGRHHTELTVTHGGSPVRKVRYRNLTPDLDLGLVIRDVLDSGMRRSQFFAG